MRRYVCCLPKSSVRNEENGFASLSFAIRRRLAEEEVEEGSGMTTPSWSTDVAAAAAVEVQRRELMRNGKEAVGGRCEYLKILDNKDMASGKLEWLMKLIV